MISKIKALNQSLLASCIEGLWHIRSKILKVGGKFCPTSIGSIETFKVLESDFRIGIIAQNCVLCDTNMSSWWWYLITSDDCLYIFAYVETRLWNKTNTLPTCYHCLRSWIRGLPYGLPLFFPKMPKMSEDLHESWEPTSTQVIQRRQLQKRYLDVTPRLHIKSWSKSRQRIKKMQQKIQDQHEKTGTYKQSCKAPMLWMNLFELLNIDIFDFESVSLTL